MCSLLFKEQLYCARPFDYAKAQQDDGNLLFQEISVSVYSISFPHRAQKLPYDTW